MLIGIDEVGRGAWAGPLVVGLVRFLDVPDFVHELRDSKVLSVKKRNDLGVLIRGSAEYSIGTAEPTYIDEHGLTLAMQYAILTALKNFQNITEIVIDGSVNFLKGTEHESLTTTLIQADQQLPEAMASSIIAKVWRDNYMKQVDAQYPGYGFGSHVGYGTKQHIAALKTLGVTPVHRRSYKPILDML